jgi:hypothetical protein
VTQTKWPPTNPGRFTSFSSEGRYSIRLSGRPTPRRNPVGSGPKFFKVRKSMMPMVAMIQPLHFRKRGVRKHRAPQKCLAQVRPAQIRRVQVRPDQVRLAQVRPAQVRLAQVRPDQVRLAQVRIRQVWPDQYVLAPPRVPAATPFLSNATCSSFAMETMLLRSEARIYSAPEPHLLGHVRRPRNRPHAGSAGSPFFRALLPL